MLVGGRVCGAAGAHRRQLRRPSRRGRARCQPPHVCGVLCAGLSAQTKPASCPARAPHIHTRAPLCVCVYVWQMRHGARLASRFNPSSQRPSLSSGRDAPTCAQLESTATRSRGFASDSLCWRRLDSFCYQAASRWTRRTPFATTVRSTNPQWSSGRAASYAACRSCTRARCASRRMGPPKRRRYRHLSPPHHPKRRHHRRRRRARHRRRRRRRRCLTHARLCAPRHRPRWRRTRPPIWWRPERTRCWGRW